MSEMPIKGEAEVAPVSGLPTPYLQPTPTDFGALAQAANEVQGVIKEKQRKYQDELALNASFAADAADLDFAKKASEVWAEFREKRGMAPTEALNEAQDKLEQYRRERGAALKDPRATKLYQSASRRRLEDKLGQMEMWASSEREQYQLNLTNGQIDDALEQIRAGYDKPEAVAAGIQQAIVASDKFWGGTRGMPEEELNSKAHALMVKGVEAALGEAVGGALDDPAAAQAGLKLLHGMLQFGDQSVDVSELLGAKAKTWAAKLKDAKSDGQAITLGAEAYLSGKGTSWLRKLAEDKTIDPKTYAKAVQQYTNLASEHHTLSTIADDNRFKTASDHLADLNWDIEAYRRSFGREYQGLEGDRAKLEALAASMSNKGLNPDQEREWSGMIDMMRPGWTDGKTLEGLLREKAALIGPVHWKELVDLFQKDRSRPADQDGQTGMIMEALDTKLREAFKMGGRLGGRDWGDMPISVINARNWAVAQMQRAVAQHHDETRKGGKVTDPTWYLKPLDALTASAVDFKKSKIMPGTPVDNRPPPPRNPSAGAPKIGTDEEKLGLDEGTIYFDTRDNQYHVRRGVR